MPYIKQLDLYNAALQACKMCLAIKPGEFVLVITDEPKRRIGRAFFDAAKALKAEACLTEILPRESNGSEPPPPVAELLLRCNVFIIPTSKSMSHTNARRNACKNGARGVTLPGILEDTMRRTLIADYNEIAKTTQKIVKYLEGAKHVHITTKAGTDVTMDISTRHAHPDIGLVHKPGEFSNLPAGEAYLAPMEGKTNGIVVVDGSIAQSGVLKRPMTIEIKDGYAVKMRGEYAKEFESHMKKFGQNAFNVAELGIGTNPKAKIIGSILEDEKILGTVHIAYGDNTSMGGKVQVSVHEDGIIQKPTVVVDNKTLMRDGKLVFE